MAWYFAPRIRFVPMIAALLVVVTTVSLGQWQLGRARQKLEQQSQLDAQSRQAPLQLEDLSADVSAVLHRRIALSGEFMSGATVLLENRPHPSGRSGFHVVTPLRLSGSGQVLLVNRGWMPRDPADRTRVRHFMTPAGEVRLEGVALAGAGQVYQLGVDRGVPAQGMPATIRQNLDIATVGRENNWRMLPFVLQQSTDTGDGLARDWPQPASGVERHQGYAFQWFALAATTFGLALFFTLFQRGGATASPRDQQQEQER